MKMSIYKNIVSQDDASKIVRVDTLRVITPTPDFEGFGEKGSINKAKFQELADVLEPTNTGWDLK